MADDDLRRLVHAAAAQPSGALPMRSILDRARRRRLHRRVAATVAPLFVVLAGVAAVATGLPGQEVELSPLDDAETADPTPTPTPSPSPEPTPTPAPTEAPAPEPTPDPTPAPEEDDDTEAVGFDEVTVYFAREHESGVWVEPEVVPLDEPTVGVARAAMDALVSYTPREPGRRTLAADGATVRGVNIDGDVLVVDFSGLVDAQGVGGSSHESALLQQIAHTGAQFDGIRAVQILIDGRRVESLGGHFDISDPVEPAPFSLSPITIESHTGGDAVQVGAVTVSGEACTFEAWVGLTLVAPDGTTAEETFTTATSGCPERGRWQHTFTLHQPGTWTIIAVEDDASEGEGRPPFEVRLELEAS